MEKIFILVFLVLVVYLLARFLEYRFLENEEERPNIKHIVRDAIVVGASTVVGGTLLFYLDGYLIGFFNSVMNSDLASKIVDRENIQIFTDDPGF